jgi:hypothetical protein
MYPIINLNDELKLQNALSEIYGFSVEEIKIETFYDNHSQRPYYLDSVNHYLLFKVKELYFLSVDGELELLGRER